jgi:hypothetical protein
LFRTIHVSGNLGRAVDPRLIAMRTLDVEHAPVSRLETWVGGGEK